MSKLGQTCGKKLRLKFDTSGIADQDHLYALLDSVVSDDEDEINNLIGDSDTEFEVVRNDVTEVLQEDKTGDNDVISINQIDAVVHLTNDKEDESGVSLNMPSTQRPTNKRNRDGRIPKCKLDSLTWSPVSNN